jgi:hypothetical protein
MVYHQTVARIEKRRTPRLVRTSEATYQRLQEAGKRLGLHLGEVAERGLEALEKELACRFDPPSSCEEAATRG